ncbi:hypothetical protein ISS06_00435 [Patescibacteria group bacterium]|nr:hypothetical protein [Patescibacteria group bacterium]
MNFEKIGQPDGNQEKKKEEKNKKRFFKDLVNKMMPEKGIDVNIEELPNVVGLEIDKLRKHYNKANENGLIHLRDIKKFDSSDDRIVKYKIWVHIDKHDDHGKGYIGSEHKTYEAEVKDGVLVRFNQVSSFFRGSNW